MAVEKMGLTKNANSLKVPVVCYINHEKIKEIPS